MMMMILCAVTTIVLLATLTTAATVDDTCMRYGLDIDQPGASCSDIYHNNPSIKDQSGYYLIKTNLLFLAHCDKDGWMRVADFDASRGDECPTGWNRITANNVRMCRSPNDAAGCYSTTFSVNGTGYRKIRGKVRGYQKNSPDSFFNGKGTSINAVYVDGIFITIGKPRRLVWTYAAGLSDDGDNPKYNCPCAAVAGPAPPSFVGEHYYCESGNTGVWENVYHTDDPLWDGAGCIHPNNNCCTNVGLPWFIREFPIAQHDDIEVRICTDSEYVTNEAVLVDQLQLYIQ